LLFHGLNNNPQQRVRITYPYVWWDNAFTEEQLNKIAAYCQSVEMNAGETFAGVNENIRTSLVNFHSWNEENKWIFEILNDVITRINARWYGLDLNGYEKFQYAEYTAEQQGKYDWHMDTHLGDENVLIDQVETRKLSLSLLLNEPGVGFDGGEFQFNLGKEEDAFTVPFVKGRIIAFPSWMIHRVRPVTKGVRKSVVIWVTGPKFI
jgi:PKHD-type hydroxylase